MISFFENYIKGIPAIIIDCRASIPEIKGKSGVFIKSFFDEKISEISPNSIPYRIETEKGVLAGYFVIEVQGAGLPPIKKQQFLRPAFQGDAEIIKEIDNFTTSGKWMDDFLTVNKFV